MIMDLFFETQSGSTFSIEVDYWDTVLDIKKKIEKDQGIPVSEQTLFSQDKCLLEDDLDIEQCKIFHNSRLQVFRNANHDNDQVLHITKPVMVGSTKNVNSNQVLQTEQYPPLDSVEQIISDQDLPVTVQVQSTQLSNSVKEFINVQDSPVKGRIKVGSNNNNNDQTEEFPPLNTVKDVVNIKESPVKMRSNNNNTQVLQTEKSPTSNSNKEIINIPDSPYPMPVEMMRFTVFVLPYSGESNTARKIPVDVKPWANVETLRNDLVQIQLDLPQEGYCFIHNQRKMFEDKSFICMEQC